MNSFLILKYVSSFPASIFFSLCLYQNVLKLFINNFLIIQTNWFSLRFWQEVRLIFNNWRIYIAEVYHAWIPLLCKAVDKQYASFSSTLDVFSSLCRYLTIESKIEKYIGNRPVSERTAKFKVFLFTLNYTSNILSGTCLQYYFYKFPQI